MKLRHCVATTQGLTGSWYSGRRKKMHRALGMSDRPLFKGRQATHAASCMSPCMSLCGTLHVTCPLSMAHVVALAPQHGTQQGAPTALSTRGKQSQLKARQLYNIA